MRPQVCENYHPIPGPVNQSRPMAAAPLHDRGRQREVTVPAHTENRGPRRPQTSDAPVDVREPLVPALEVAVDDAPGHPGAVDLQKDEAPTSNERTRPRRTPPARIR